MSTTQKLLIPVALLVAVVLSLSVWNALRDHQLRQNIESQCWVAGGEYRNGTCGFPEDIRTDQAKVCEALNGSYVIVKNKRTGVEDFTCYDREGKEKTLPDLTGKEVIVMHDGTLVLRDKRK